MLCQPRLLCASSELAPRSHDTDPPSALPRCTRLAPAHRPWALVLPAILPQAHLQRAKNVQQRVEKARQQAMLGGGAAAIDKRHSQGRLTARERINLLLDPTSFREYDMLMEHRCTDFEMEKKQVGWAAAAEAEETKGLSTANRADCFPAGRFHFFFVLVSFVRVPSALLPATASSAP